METLNENAVLLGNMSEFAEFPVKLYRGVNEASDGYFFAKDGDQSPDPMELVVFDSKYEGQRIYVRMPHDDKFTPMYGHGSGARSAGKFNMSSSKCRNVLKEINNPFVYEGVVQSENVEIHESGSMAMVKISDSVVFLKKVGVIDRFDSHDNFGVDIIKSMHSKKCYVIPDKRTIAYALRTAGNDVVIVDQSEYDFQYETMRCFYGNVSKGIRQGTITNFERYRDGGTTKFNFTLDDATYEFFYPSSFPSKSHLKPTWAQVEATDLSETEIDFFVQQLGIDLAQKVNVKR